MRILYVSSSTVPSRSANSVHVMKMCQALAEQGHEVRLLTLDRPAQREEGITDVHAHYGVKANFEVKSLPFPKFPGGQAIFAMAAWWETIRWRPELIYGRYFPAMAMLGWMGFPVILESHERVWDRGQIGRIMAEQLFRAPGFRHLVVISEALKKMYVDAGLLEAERICVAHDAADPAPQFPREEGAFRVGYLGGIYPGRGIELLLGCAKALPDVEFHFVGGTREDLRELAGEAPGENVIGHGYQPPDKIPELRGKLDVLLAPYQKKVAVFGGGGDTSAFMSPLKIFEYMASGRPMICSDLPVLREVLNEENAVLVDPEDEAGWTRAIDDLRQNPDRAKQIADKALQDFEAHYTWDIRAKLVLSPCGSST